MKAYIANGNDGYEVFLDKEVWKEPCQTEAELDNLPNLKFVMIDKLQDYNKSGKALRVVPEGRILNLEKFSVPKSSSRKLLYLFLYLICFKSDISLSLITIEL